MESAPHPNSPPVAPPTTTTTTTTTQRLTPVAAAPAVWPVVHPAPVARPAPAAHLVTSNTRGGIKNFLKIPLYHIKHLTEADKT